MSALAVDLRSTAGFLVADAKGRIVGRVECPMYGTLARRRPTRSRSAPAFSPAAGGSCPAESIEQIDDGSRVIGLRVERDSIRTFL